MSKVTGSPLLSADQYEWIGVQTWNRFEARGQRINLQTITNERIEALLKADPKYWGEKFRKLEPKTESKKAKDSDKKVFED